MLAADLRDHWQLYINVVVQWPTNSNLIYFTNAMSNNNSVLYQRTNNILYLWVITTTVQSNIS